MGQATAPTCVKELLEAELSDLELAGVSCGDDLAEVSTSTQHFSEAIADNQPLKSNRNKRPESQLADASTGSARKAIKFELPGGSDSDLPVPAPAPAGISAYPTTSGAYPTTGYPVVSTQPATAPYSSYPTQSGYPTAYPATGAPFHTAPAGHFVSTAYTAPAAVPPVQAYTAYGQPPTGYNYSTVPTVTPTAPVFVPAPTTPSSAPVSYASVTAPDAQLCANELLDFLTAHPNEAPALRAYVANRRRELYSTVATVPTACTASTAVSPCGK